MRCSRLLCVAVVVAALSATLVGCPKKDEENAAAKEPKPAAQPAGPTDADRKKAAAIDLAVQIDGRLATLEHVERELPVVEGKPKRKAEGWFAAPQRRPEKVVVKELDAAGNTTSAVDAYFDAGTLKMVRATDGTFLFEMETLALWLGTDMKVKRGIKPSEAGARARELKELVAEAQRGLK